VCHWQAALAASVFTEARAKVTTTARRHIAEHGSQPASIFFVPWRRPVDHSPGQHPQTGVCGSGSPDVFALISPRPLGPGFFEIDEEQKPDANAFRLMKSSGPPSHDGGYGKELSAG
jgi:hypothetical protein